MPARRLSRAVPSTPAMPGPSRRRCAKRLRKSVSTRPASTWSAPFIPPTGFRVVPVLAWWRQPCPVAPVDTGEVAAVARVSVAELADPGVRLMTRGPGGFVMPAFQIGDLLIWGFTAALVDRLLALGGWERPWDEARIVDL
jgi:hypothetical protein